MNTDTIDKHQTTIGDENQSRDSILEDSNHREDPISDNADVEAWVGDLHYFQSGKKAGQLKPSARDSGKSLQFEGLNFDSLKATPISSNIESAKIIDKKMIKAEKKSSDARVGAKIAMRILDTIISWISRGTYGAEFTKQQREDRNKYREELENDWREYLLTLDIPLHPGLIVLFGSITYVGDAFTSTTAGQEKAKSFKEKIISKIAVGIFSRGENK